MSVCLFMAQHSPLEPEALARRDEGELRTTIAPARSRLADCREGLTKGASEPPVVEVIPRGAGRLDLVVVVDQVEPPVVEVIPRGGAPR